MSAVAVIGATGYLGKYLSRELLSRGITVRATYRRDPWALVSGVEPKLVSDVSDTAALESAMAGANAVIHLAARVHVAPGDSAEAMAAFRKVNVEGTRNILDAARRAGVERLIYLSTVKVFGEGRSDRAYAENDEPAPQNPYALSKLEAEDVIRSAGNTIKWTILRPPVVYGEGVEGNIREVFRLADFSCRYPLPLGGVRNRRSMVCAGNLCDAIVRSTQSDAAAGRTFTVADDVALSTPDLIREIARHLGGKAKLVSVPSRAVRSALNLFGRQTTANRLLNSLTVESGAIRLALGWEAPFTVHDGLRRTAEWWKTATQGSPRMMS